MEILARLSLLFLSLLVLPHSANAGDTLTPSKPLSGNRTLISPTGLFALGFFTPAGTNNTYVGVWYNNIRLQTIVWVANRNTPVAAEATLFISRNGTLLITDSNSTVIWSSVISAPLNNSLAELLDNGNFVVREADSAHRFAWQSFDYPTDTIIPGMKIGVDFGAGINHSVAAWRSGSDPAAGSYTAAIDVHGDPQIFLRSGSESLWRSGPWNGFQFSGVPEITSYRQLSISFFFVNTKEEVSYSFLSTNKSIVTRLLLNQSGKLQRAVWVWDTEQWNFFWQAPGDQCDIYTACGPFGVCDPDESPVCDCLRGFTPMDPTKWALQDGSGGCRRMTALDCRNLTDGFVTLAGAKLPDTAATAVDMSMGLDKCRETCLRNCSCTAFAAANLSSESGCLIWVTDLVDIRRYSGGGGQDLYVRLAAADLGAASGGHHHSKKSTAVIVSCVLVAVFLAFVAVGCYWGLRKRRKQSNNNFHGGRVMGQEEHRDSSCELPCFQLADLAAATDYFSEENKLGEGGFGPVYKGRLADGQEIAVKRLSRTSAQGAEEFKNEVRLIAKLQHRNLVRLLGCCVHAEERMVVYEFMPNKSLDAFLFDKEKSLLLHWKARYKIIFGIARGLLYLHQDSRFHIIHRDLKASNILLDEDLTPKISDFGMARIFGGNETQVNTTKVVGTFGYMSPEYAMDGIFSPKSDVFSFGVLALEIISGRRNRGVYTVSPYTNLLGHAWSLWNKGNSLKLADEAMNFAFPVDELLKCIKIGLLCVQGNPEDRPLMPWIVLMLAGDCQTPFPEPKQPGFLAGIPLETSDSLSSKQESTTMNDFSASILDGR